MKKFLLRTILFLALSTLMMVLLDVAITYQAHHSQQRPYWKWNQTLKGGIDADMLIIGNSRAWAHFSPFILDSALGVNSFNLGIDGSGINRQIMNYHIYRQRNAKPKVIIHNIDPSTLNFTTGYERHQFFPYFNSRQMRDSIFPLEPFSWAEKFLPMYRYSNYGLDNFFDKKPYTMYKGYAGQNRTWNDSPTSHYSKAKGYIRDTNGLLLLEKHLAQAKTEGIQVILVFSPIFNDYFQTYPHMDEFWEDFQRFSQQFDIPFLDYTQMPICFDTTYFYNPAHLNTMGAEYFSRQLAADINKLYPELFTKKTQSNN